MERPYRCLGEECSHEFYAPLVRTSSMPKPLVFCPKCGLDSSDDMVIELCIIHFVPPSRKRGVGLGILACTGKGWVNRMATANPDVVTCNECKATDFWKTAIAKYFDYDRSDYELAGK